MNSAFSGDLVLDKAKPKNMNIINVGYDSTNYYILSNDRPKLMFDTGWSNTLPKLQAQCKRMGINLVDVKHVLISHYHPDHAGLAQELKNIGMRLIVMKRQEDAIPKLRNYMKPANKYIDIVLTDNIVIDFPESRQFLAGLGIKGEIIPTIGHSDDSVSLILDSGEAFIGDFPPPIVEDTEHPVYKAWEAIRSLKVKRIYSGHVPVWELK
jgi:endoribonuclease LACTB2